MLRNLVDCGITIAIIVLLLVGASIGKPAEQADYAPRTVMELIKATGLAGLLILFWSIFGAVKIVRYLLSFREAELSRPGLLEETRRLLAAGDVDRALSLARSSPCYAGRVLTGVLGRRPAGPEAMLEGLDRVAPPEIQRLKSRVGNLLLIAILVLMLGVLGTATGLISTFQLIEQLRAPTPSDLAGGVYEALVNLAFGLSSATILIPAFLLMRRKVSSLTLGINAEIGELLATAAPLRA